MAFDYKKEYKEFYLPSRKPHLITVPPMNFVTVQGKGDPNDPAGEYQAAMEVLYGLAYTIKMSYKGSHRMKGFFEYVVPPLEGLWHQQGVDGVDYAHKETFEWTSMIRLPEFDPGRVRLGRAGSRCQEKAGLFCRLLLSHGGGLVCADDAPGPL